MIFWYLHTDYLYTRGVNGGVTIWKNPIVQDVRKAGEELAKQIMIYTPFSKICGTMKSKKMLR